MAIDVREMAASKRDNEVRDTVEPPWKRACQKKDRAEIAAAANSV
jgi:hypothetical protein